MQRQKRIYFGYNGWKRERRRKIRLILLCGLLIAALCGAFFGVRYLVENGYFSKPEIALEEEPEPEEEPPAPVKVKGLYISAHVAGIEDRLSNYIKICDTTEVNTVVIDVKDDRGQITFDSAIDGASEANSNIIPDIGKTISLLKSHGIYTIARVVCFKDPIWSRLNPELAISNTKGAPWKDNSGVTWLDPYKTESWDYIAAVAKEAARVGFDEVQLDYVRFPSDGRLREITYGDAGNEKSKADVINEFLTYIRASLSEERIKLSADIFGIAVVNKGDLENIGQDFELLVQSADCICPMIYPSHFSNKRQNGIGQEINLVIYEAPDKQPYEVVYNTLLLLKARLPEYGGHAVIRPYLQDFTAAYLGAGYYLSYEAEQVREQIRAVYDAGFEEWILWNASGTYSEDAFMMM